MVSQNNDYNELIKKFNEMDKRLRRIESQLKISSPTSKFEPEVVLSEDKSGEKFEQTVGQFWFAKVGVVILTLAFLLLVNLRYEGIPQFIPVLAGLLIGGTFFLLSHYSKKSFNFVSRYLFGGGLVIIFTAALRMHFFGSEPIIQNAAYESILLILVAGGTLFASLKRDSVYLAALGFLMGYFAALINENSFVIFAILTLLSVSGVYFVKLMKWRNLLFLNIFFTYFTHLIWAMHNPFLTGKFEFVGAPEINLGFLLLYMAIFAYGICDKECPVESYAPVAATFFNLALGYGLFFTISILKFEANLAVYHTLASIVFLTIAILMWTYSKKDYYSIALNAIAGYSALSVAIVAFFDAPDYFNVLIWESIIVILTSIFFKSKFIIYANFGMFLAILFAFLLSAGEFSLISLSFGIVALLSARLLHWKHEYLDFGNQFLRNGYLTVAFITIPLALYQSVPKDYIIYTWIGVTALYYLLSILLTNYKYRWMGHLTLLLTVVYILIIGTTEFDPIYRILAFIAVGVALLIVSIVYTRQKIKSENKTE